MRNGLQNGARCVRVLLDIPHHDYPTTHRRRRCALTSVSLWFMAAKLAHAMTWSERTVGLRAESEIRGSRRSTTGVKVRRPSGRVPAFLGFSDFETRVELMCRIL